MENKIKLTVVLASTRNGRRGKKVAKWFLPIVKEDSRFEVTLADLKEYALPFYEDQVEPSDREDRKYPDPKVQAWSDVISGSDAVVFVMPEYNRTISAPLKNAIDHLYWEWLDKPVGLIGYGSRGAQEAIDSMSNLIRILRWKVAPSIVGVQQVKKAFDENGKLDKSDEYAKTARQMLDQLAAIYDSVNK
jgi:NAD(P)H-dependent FMN reductase